MPKKPRAKRGSPKNVLRLPDLAASVRRVKGAKKLGFRLGNWLTCAQGRRLLEALTSSTQRAKEIMPSWPFCWALASGVQS
jgi:hypothetical protein